MFKVHIAGPLCYERFVMYEMELNSVDLMEQKWVMVKLFVLVFPPYSDCHNKRLDFVAQRESRFQSFHGNGNDDEDKIVVECEGQETIQQNDPKE